MLFFNLIPNIWNDNTFGQGGRVYGPSIISFNLLLFYYLLTRKTFDKKLVLAAILGLVYIALTSNFMNLVIFLLLVILLSFDFRKLFRPVYIFSTLFFLIGLFLYLNSPYVPELISNKLEYVFKPWEYGSFKTRIDDFNQVVANEDFGFFKQLFGEGFGTSSQIYRYNPISVSLSRTFSFQEIDNGFYYLYHRGGWSLLVIFIVSHLYLLLKINNIKAKMGFFIFVFFTCLLSIHYFNYYYYLLIPFFILNRKIVQNSNTE